MSVRVMTLVWESDLPPHHKLVLLAYADHANDQGTSIYPGEHAMAAKTSYSEGNIRRVTKELVEAGWLQRVKRGHRGQRAQFAVNIQALKAAQYAHQTDGKGAQSVPERRADCPEKARAQATPNVIEPSLTEEDHRDLLWESFVTVHGEPADRSERGKYNRQVKKLRDAGVAPDEYALLVHAYVRKHNGLQPGVATVAERIGELRHYTKHGPVTTTPSPQYWQRSVT